MSGVECGFPIAIRKIPNFSCCPMSPDMVHSPHLFESSPNNGLCPIHYFSAKKGLLSALRNLQKAFFFSIIGSMHLLFFCFFCLECFPTDSTWLAHFVITISTQISSPGRHYITITLKKAQTLSHHPTFLLHNIHHNIKFMYLPVLLPTMDRELHKVWSTGCVVCAMLFTVCLQYLVHSRSLINNVE